MIKVTKIAMSYVLSIIFFLLLSTIIPGQTQATNYYVDATTGNDNNPGTSTKSAWKTIAKVQAKMIAFKPNDHIKLKRGETWYESLQITKPGTVYEAYGTGNLPILDGSNGIATEDWSSEENNIYSCTVPSEPNLLFYQTVPKPSITVLRFSSVPSALQKKAVLLQLDNYYSSFWVTSISGSLVSGITRFTINPNVAIHVRQIENGVEKQWPKTMGTTTTVYETAGLTKPGDWFWYNKRIYLHAEEHPGNSVRISKHNDGIRIDADNVTVQDIQVQRQNKQGIVLFNSEGSRVKNMSIFACGKTGIQMWNTSNNIIENNTIDSNSGGISLYALPGGKKTLGNIIRNNTISNCRAAAIGLSSDEKGSPADVSDNTISGNSITNANTMSYDGAGVYTFNAGSNAIHANFIANCGSIYLRSAGIMVDMSVAPMSIQSNRIYNNSTGGIAVSGAGHQIVGNILYNNGLPGMDGRGQLMFFNAGTPASNCKVSSNIIEAHGNRHFVVGNGGSTSNHTINYNSYIGQPLKQFSWEGKWMDFETWQDNTRHDLSSRMTPDAL